MMPVSSPHFKEHAAQALEDSELQQALGRLKTGFQANRRRALEAMPHFEALRDYAVALKNHTLAHLDHYLVAFEEKVLEQGGKVHWADDAAEANRIIAELCRQEDARRILKGKSMITEEIGLNAHLEEQGFEVVETDLGEYIIQLRGETPSHIIAPALHISKESVAKNFREAHRELDPERELEDRRQLLDEARAVLRSHFLEADVGITGANLLIAETGSTVIVTNEGNGDLSQTMTRAHIVVASIEKIVPTLEDADVVLRLLARSATGQQLSTYTTFSTGPHRSQDTDGPASFHVVLYDGGRTEALGTPSQEMLRCIRCGACMNHCPVYGAVGGHAYGWVYPGPIGAVLNPQLKGIENTQHLPNASSFCGRCEEVCPVKIPLPGIMRYWREQAFTRKLVAGTTRTGLGLWAALARRPRLYRLATGLAARLLVLLGGKRRSIRNLPFAGGWTGSRDMPAPEGKTFFQQLKERET